MKAIILAAGIGSRLRPITNSKPKCMVKVSGKPIIEWQIQAYLHSGITEDNLYIVVGYKNDIIEKLINEKYPKVNIIINDDYLITNNMYSLNLGLEEIDVDDEVIISNGDCIYDFSLVKGFVDDMYPDLVACESEKYINESMKIMVDQKNVITDISKSISDKEFFATSIDLYKLSTDSISKLRKIINEFLKNDRNSWTEVALNMLFKQCKFLPFDISKKRWIEIDNYEDLLLAEKLFSEFNINEKKAFILDLDGTVYLGNTPIKKSIEFINNGRDRFDFFFMTNNTSKSKKNYLEKLNKLGIEKINEEMIITPTLPLCKFLLNSGIEKVYCLGTKFLFDELNSLGIYCVNDSELELAQAVIVGFDTELTYQKLRDACLLLQKSNIEYYATHEDKVCPTENGYIPDIGSILSLIETATSRKPQKIFGKPNKELLNPILCKYKNHEVVIVGDRLYTDKVLAENSNIDFILVLTGESDRTQVEELAAFPQLILRELGDLFE